MREVSYRNGVKILLLWDVDGTLINTGSAGMSALRTALQTVFGINRTLDDIDFAGRSDLLNMREVLSKVGLPATEINFARLTDGYLAALPAKLADPSAHVLPGVRTLLDAVVAQKKFTQGLLTGNFRRGAELKIGHHRLWSYFGFGAFADDNEHRNELGPHALRRCHEFTGIEFQPSETWIIGDTPHDIQCGKVIGANTIAVATGS